MLEDSKNQLFWSVARPEKWQTRSLLAVSGDSNLSITSIEDKTVGFAKVSIRRVRKKFVVNGYKFYRHGEMLTRNQFEKLFDTYIDDVSSFLYTYASDKAQVKDWTQEVFIKVWEKRDGIDFDHPAFKSYLLKTARNHALKKLKKAKRYNRWLEENLERYIRIQYPGDPFDNASDLEGAYAEALAKISLRSQKAYLLSREEGLTYPEIAEVMDISTKTVETHISNALQVLRRELKGFTQNSYQ